MELHNPLTHEVDYPADVIAFLRAMDKYKRVCHRPYPDCRDVLELARLLGYRRVAERTELPTFKRCGGSGIAS